MIAIDTSALIAILLDEPKADACSMVLRDNFDLVISATVLTEAMIVANSRGGLAQLQKLLAATPVVVVPTDGETASRVAQVYARWGKGNHPSRLNLIDCFSYDLARQMDCALLFVGDDFSQTDIARALT